jgi:kinesin family protein 15
MLENNQNKNNHNKSLSSNNRDDNINVIVRIRGIGNDENYESSFLNILDEKTIQVDDKTYYYDYIANMNSTQEEMFQHCAKRICDNSLKGYNGTIFAYGQTGSGKTYTLLGRNITKYIEQKTNTNYSFENINSLEINEMSQDNDLMNINMNTNNRKTDNSYQNLYNYDVNDQGIGLLPRIIYYLFQNSQKTENVDFKFKISYLEIYQNNISDLLNPDNSKFIQLRDTGSNIILDGLRKLIINSPEEAIKFVIQGNKLRHTAATLMNNESSRSHAVISIYIEKTISQKENKNRTKIQKSVFHIIDLAGSERQDKTGANGERTREAGGINKSLMNLKRVITSIIKNQKQVPYRDSKLTHLLKDSLGGNSKTSIIAAISPFDKNKSETISTLIFAQDAKKVKNHALVNEEVSAGYNLREMKFLENYNSVLQENFKLKEELMRYRREQKDNNTIINLQDIEGFDRGLNEISRDINNLKEQNARLKDEIEKSDLEIKIRDKKIESQKEQMNNYVGHIRSLIKEKNDYFAKNSILTGQLKEEENEKIKLEKHYKDQILIMEENNTKTDQIINNKGVMIDELTKRINEYINKIAEKDKQIHELSLGLEEKNNTINEIKNKKDNEIETIQNLTKKINQLNEENERKQKEIEELRKNNKEIKCSGINLLRKSDEDRLKISDEIAELKNIIKDRDKKIENAKKLYHSLEQAKLLIENKLEEKSNNINSYLKEISNLNQRNRILKVNYDILKADYDKLYTDSDNTNESNTNSNTQNHSKNIFKEKSNNLSKRNAGQRNKAKNSSKSPSPINNLNNVNNNYKKCYEELKQKYEATLKKISGGKKIKNVQDLLDKLNIIEKDLNECRRIMNSSFTKIQDLLSKDVLISDILNQPFDFNCNYLDGNIEQKFFVFFEKFLEFHMLLENQLKNMKEQNEILNQNIHLNEEKKELFELNNNDDKSLNSLIANVAYKSIAKNRKGYLFNNLSTNTKKAFEGYNIEYTEIQETKEEEKNNENNNGNDNNNKYDAVNLKQDINKKNIKINMYPNKTNNNNNILNLFGKENNNIK